jgi:hypothetical protein
LSWKVPWQRERVHEKAKPVTCCINPSGKVIHALCGNGKAGKFGRLALKFREKGEWSGIGFIARCEDIVVRERGWSGLSEA